MAELLKLLESNAAFRSELLPNLLSSTQLTPGEATETSFTSGLQQVIDQNLNRSGTTLDRSVVSLDQENMNISTSSSGSRLDQDNMNVLISSPGTSQLMESSLDTNIRNNNLAPIVQSAMFQSSPTVQSPTTREAVTSSRVWTPVATRQETESADSRLLEEGNGSGSTEAFSLVLSQVQETLSESRKLLVDQVTEAIVQAHLTTTINTHANVAEAGVRVQTAGSEINANIFWQNFQSAMLPEITKVIKFCNKLPGVSELSQEDKVILIKEGCFKVMVTRFCLLVDPEEEMMFDPTLRMKVPRYIVQDTPMGEFLDQFFSLASQFNKLRLTDGEIGLFTAVVLLAPDHQGLTDRAAINILRQLFLQTLFLSLELTHSDASDTLRSLIQQLPDLHRINKEHVRFLKMLKSKSPTDFENKFPTLHRELFDTSSECV